MKKLIILSLVLLLNSCSTTPESKDREVCYVQIGDAYLPVYTLGTTPNPEKVILLDRDCPPYFTLIYPFFKN